MMLMMLLIPCGSLELCTLFVLLL